MLAIAVIAVITHGNHPLLGDGPARSWSLNHRPADEVPWRRG
ncbi:hypothetical protein ACFVXC_18400 [Streptomyces sp. NPDC058257]